MWKQHVNTQGFEAEPHEIVGHKAWHGAVLRVCGLCFLKIFCYQGHL